MRSTIFRIGLLVFCATADAVMFHSAMLECLSEARTVQKGSHRL